MRYKVKIYFPEIGFFAESYSSYTANREWLVDPLIELPPNSFPIDYPTTKISNMLSHIFNYKQLEVHGFTAVVITTEI